MKKNLVHFFTAGALLLQSLTGLAAARPNGGNNLSTGSRNELAQIVNNPNPTVPYSAPQRINPDISKPEVQFCNEVMNIMMQERSSLSNTVTSRRRLHTFLNTSLGSRDTPNRRTLGYQIFETMMLRFQGNNAVGNANANEVRSYCEREFDSIIPTEFGANVSRGALGITDTASTHLKTLKDRLSELMGRCSVSANEAICPPEVESDEKVGSLQRTADELTHNLEKTPVVAPMDKARSGSDANAQEANVCSCALSITQNLNDDEGRRFVAEKKAKGIELIQTALNKKFLDSYSQNIEDMKFFVAKKGSLLDRIPEANALELSCNKQEDFEQEIQSACAQSGVGQSEIDKRKRDLFNLLGAAAPGISPNDNWGNLEDKISNLPFNGRENLPEGMGDVLKREVFDDIRHGLSQSEPAVNQLNVVLSRLINLESFKRSLVSDRSPMDNIKQFLELKSQDNANWSKTVKDLTAGLPEGFSSMFEHAGASTFEEIAREASFIAPSLRIALTEKSVFNSLVSEAHNSGRASKISNVIETLETDPMFLYDGHLKGKCQAIKKEFANAVCNNQASLFSKIPNDQLDNIFATLDPVEFQVMKAISCSVPKAPAHERFDIALPVPPSSLTNRLQNGDENTDFFEIVMNGLQADDDKFRRYVKAVTISNEGSAVVASSSGLRNNFGLGSYTPGRSTSRPSPLDYIDDSGKISETKVGTSFRDQSSNNVAQTNNVSNISAESSQQSGSLDSQNSISQTDQTGNTKQTVSTQENQTFNYSNYLQNPSEVQRTSQSEVARAQLKESISNESNSAAVDSFVSNISDPQVEELKRLRDEIQRNKDSLNQLNSRANQQRISQLESELNELRERRNVAIAETPSVQPTEAQRRLVPASEFTVVKPSANESRQPASINQERNANPADNSSTSNIASNNSNTALLSGQTSPSGNSSALDSGILVISNDVKQNSPDVNNEVLRFLETEPDLQVLTQLREQGMKFRFKVMKNGQESIEEVVVNFERLSQEAKDLILNKIERRRGLNRNLISIENDIFRVQRQHSYESLKLIIGQQSTTRL